jgi:putative SOS response-associated peptidase YedK
VTSLSRLIETGSVTELRHYPVSLYVNNPRNEGPKCIEPLSTDESKQEARGAPNQIKLI